MEDKKSVYRAKELENGKYVGDMVEDTFDGIGRYMFNDGIIYYGNFSNGKYNGSGVLLYPSSYAYFGKYKNNKREGRGISLGFNGEVYDGHFVNDIFEGKGKKIESNGTIYEGEFINWKIQGEGKITYPDGSRYEGELNDGLPFGNGKLIENGIVYEGSFIQGVRNGHFKEYPESEPECVKETIYNCGHQINLYDYKKKSVDRKYDEYSFVSGKNAGNCKKLCGKIAVVLIYCDDNENLWDEDSRIEYKKKVNDSLWHLVNSAKDYGTVFTFNILEYDDKYDNTITFEPSHSFYSEYRSKEPEYKRMTEEIKGSGDFDEAAIILAFNKDFRSYSYMVPEASQHFEIAFLSAKAEGLNQICHELLHLFGARDLYRPKEMEKWAIIYYPISIMYKAVDVFLPVDDVTAYLIGWVEGVSERAGKFLDSTKNVKVYLE